MTLPIDNGYVEVYKPKTTEPFLTLEPPDLKSVSVTSEVQDAAGKASVELNNEGGEYAGEITAGDRLEFHVSLATTGDSTTTRYGDGTYGDGTYGTPSGDTRLWSGMASIPRYSFSGPGTRTISIEAQPFAFGVMGGLGRKVDNAFRDRKVSYIAKTILQDEASVLDPSGIETFETVYDVEFDGRPLLDAMKELANVVDAVLSARGKTVYMRPLGNTPIQWSATDDDFEGGWNVDPVDDTLHNQIRIEGGVDNNVGDAQTNQSGYITVTSSSRAQFQMHLEKSRTNQVDIWTRPTGSAEDYKVRIQEDIGGAPTAPGDSSKDLVSKTLSQEFIEDDGFTEFLLERTTLPGPNPWVLIESGGASGQEIGVDSNDNATYRGYYYFPIITQKTNQSSVDEYRRREHRIERKSITTAEAASELATTTLRKRKMPRKEFSTNAASLRAHRLKPTDAVHLDIEKDDAVGDFILTTREDQYAPSSQRNQMTSKLRFTEIEAF